MRGMQDMLRQAQQMQKKMTTVQEELKTREVEGTAGGGMVTVRATGGQQIVSVVIDKSVVEAGDVEMLQDLVLAAITDALKKAKTMMEEEMGKITGGFKIPGMF
ncbi:MAG: YbaB/EbfC family nucleoid-associated protein [Humidesulfovibrio sp.]|jgi:DNA-binding YbaB/EbfC family protein|uniref:YbaB/EbfC family nucleoid-associated protein n=1 Tax=Humidesulfovibrio sp. TaxID=2910988 RepID=UPI0027373A49|nr:YbaB/EbfC family nucleoid-associated protein [Humidesulfovibrio sp.]MDP2848148.1 YbaB/EbfC family nucleoid-associated protein [Humidesulfovibrio sp.]